MYSWRGTEKFGWTDRVENEEISKESRRKILHTVKRRKAKRIGHILRRGGRGRKQLLDDLKEKRGYWILKKKDCTLRRTVFGRGCGPVVRQTV